MPIDTSETIVSRAGTWRIFLHVPFFVGIAFFSLLCHRAEGSSRDAYREAVIVAARQRELAADPYWQILLHYKPKLTGGTRSLIDDPGFFLSPEGKEKPEKELEETIRGFFNDGQGDSSPRCRFPARFSWLSRQLSIDQSQLPPASCPQLDEALAAADPKAAVLVFPAGHMNNPASMFGHTLLRIDNSYKSELLAYAVNYAAVTDETNGVAYAAKGIFGLYKGYYSILPYYDKVKEYNDMEHRDMWEYYLNLTPEETQRMVLHIWELQNSYSDYFFFDENCSYNLLFLLEAARPEAKLTDRMGFWVIPADTLRLVREEGLIARVKYRPSQAARIRRIAAALDGEQKLAALDIAEERMEPGRLPPETAQGTLDLAAELLQYRYARRELEKEAFNKQFLSILAIRSTLVSRTADDYLIDPPAQPEEGHRTGRFSLAAGFRDTRLFAEAGWRPAYHGLLDPEPGYVDGAQISFLDTNVRYYPREETLKLHKLHLVDIISLSPWDYFFRRISWKVSAGFDQEIHRDGRDHLLFRLNTGGGISTSLPGAGLAYLVGETDVNVGDSLRYNAALGFGATAGILAELNASWKMHLSAQGFYYPVGDEHLSLRGTLATDYRISRNQSIRLSLDGIRSFHHEVLEVRGGWNFFL